MERTILFLVFVAMSITGGWLIWRRTGNYDIDFFTKILFLDEPTASLDPDHADWIRTYLEQYQDRTGATFILASHNMPEVERLCSNVLMMKLGTVVDEGPPKKLINQYLTI